MIQLAEFNLGLYHENHFWARNEVNGDSGKRLYTMAYRISQREILKDEMYVHVNRTEN